MKYKIFSPSYKRPDICSSHKYFHNVTYLVDESEFQAYKQVHDKVIALPKGIQGNVARVRNWAMDNEKNLLIVDDDYSENQGICRWELNTAPAESGCHRKKLTPGQAEEFIEMGFNLAHEMGVKLWGLNLNNDKGAYREYTPFSFSSVILGPFQAHIDNDLRYDENLPLKDDYDIGIQVLNKYRMVLRFNAYHYNCDQHGKPGGCAAYRTMQSERDQNMALQRKWGSKIIQFDTGASKTHRKRELSYDINPIINIPIRGI